MRVSTCVSACTRGQVAQASVHAVTGERCCLLVILARAQVLVHFGPGSDPGHSCLEAFASKLLVSEQTANICCDILISLSSRPEIFAARRFAIPRYPKPLSACIHLQSHAATCLCRGKEFVKEMAVRFVESLFHATQEAEERSSLQIATMMALLRVLTSSLPSEELLEKACSGVASNKARLCACESARA